MQTRRTKNDLPGCSLLLAAAGSPSPTRKTWISIIFAVLFVRRERWSLTWKGRLLVLTCVVSVTVILTRGLCTFLAIASTVGGQFMVVEGWMPAYAYREAAEQFRKGGYRKVICAGVMDGDESGELRVDFGGEEMVRFGVRSDLVVTTSSDEVQRDRTFHAAKSVRLWLREQGLRATSIDVVTIGPHARRTRLLYEKALGNEFRVGIIAVEDRRYDRQYWWRSSAGVRAVVGESIAYLYARFLFSAEQ